ncbi:MAG TPA: hypothetical protein VIX80_00070 [Candidatus Kapabacteria bacterium]
MFSKDMLSMWKRTDKFSGQISDGIRIGTDTRMQFLSFSQTSPLSFDSTTNTTKDTTTSNSSYHAMNASIYIDASLTPSLDAYVKFDPLANKFEGFGLLQLVSDANDIIDASDAVNNVYVKMGAFLPAFGIRFDDHTAYVKGGNRGLSNFGGAGSFWTEGYRDVGGEVGATFFDHVSAQVGIYNGSEDRPNSNFAFQEHDMALALRLTASAEIIEDALSAELGYSMYSHPRKSFQTGEAEDLSLSAIHVGIRGGPVTLLAEIDNGDNVYSAGKGSYLPKMSALTTELGVNVTTGLTGILRYETYKDEDVAGNIMTEVKNRITFGAQWFPFRMIEIRPEYRMAKVEVHEGTVVNSITENTFLMQMHLFF